MLKANCIEFERESQVLFSNLTFEVELGTMLFVSGENGSGKSSLLKILAGIWQPTKGTVTWADSLDGLKDPYFLTELLYIGHKIGIDPALSPVQNLKWLTALSSLKAISEKAILDGLETLGLAEFRDVPCQNLSRGQCQRVALARLWINPGSCWILDEPLTGLDDIGANLFYDCCLRHLAKKGIIVLASHRSFELNSYKKVDITLGKEICLEY